PPLSSINTLSLHDALPILIRRAARLMSTTAFFQGYTFEVWPAWDARRIIRLSRDSGLLSSGLFLSKMVESVIRMSAPASTSSSRSEEHTSELQSLAYLVCR